jgi:ABC-type Fe3+/spermidine/putrescine transport system ATPase subunit
MNILELRNVTKRFGNFAAVDNVSFSVQKGKVLSLLGPSGCGKTTTLRLISGFENIDEGSIFISGKEVINKRPYERNVGLLFQDYALFPHMTVEENVKYGMKYRGFEKKLIPDRINEMLELVKLTGFKKRKPSQLSGGQQQRVALARSLATSPEIILLDEPLSALDAKLRQELRFELKEILNSVNATTIVVTHDQEEAMSLGDSVIVMNEGKIIQEGHPTDIYEKPNSKFVAEFVGRSNWFNGNILNKADDGIFKIKTTEGFEFNILENLTPKSSNGNYEICVRPERISLEKNEIINEDSYINLLPGKVVGIAHLGPDIHTVIEVSNKRMIKVVEKYTGQVLKNNGTNVNLYFYPKDCIIISSEK